MTTTNAFSSTRRQALLFSGASALALLFPRIGIARAPEFQILEQTEHRTKARAWPVGRLPVDRLFTHTRYDRSYGGTRTYGQNCVRDLILVGPHGDYETIGMTHGQAPSKQVGIVAYSSNHMLGSVRHFLIGMVSQKRGLAAAKAEIAEKFGPGDYDHDFHFINMTGADIEVTGVGFTTQRWIGGGLDSPFLWEDPIRHELPLPRTTLASKRYLSGDFVFEKGSRLWGANIEDLGMRGRWA